MTSADDEASPSALTELFKEVFPPECLGEVDLKLDAVYQLYGNQLLPENFLALCMTAPRTEGELEECKLVYHEDAYEVQDSFFKAFHM